MIKISGTTVYNSLAMGKLYFCNKKTPPLKRIKVANPRDEVLRVTSSIKIAKKELHELYEKALLSVGEANAQVFQIHIMMLEDKDFYEAILSMIKTQSVNAEYAVSYTADIFAKTFSEMDDEYMKARASDVYDISDRLINILNGKTEDEWAIGEPSIIVAEDLAPSETVRFDKEKILGFVTFKGSSTSHTAILARTMDIPAIINAAEIDQKYDGHTAILDGFNGTLLIDPSENEIADFEKRKALEEEKKLLISKLRGKETKTKSGKKVHLYANIGHPRDIPLAISNDAEGVGLFRSEFLYLEKDTFPTEDEQFKSYKEASERMNGKKVIIRTLDIGADKKIDYFNLPTEENPALGFRAIRICLSDTSLFKTQLRAILRASAFGNISIMFPMITSLDEVLKAKKIFKECKDELKNEGIGFKEDMELGIMIETPAAAIISDILAPEVDFFSIGTNDLTQYTLALDRQNHLLEPFLDTHHEAILRLIEWVTKNAHQFNKWVGICGELASDLNICEKLLSLQIDELSVSPSQVLKVREKIRSLD